MGLFSAAKLFGVTIRESATDGSDFTNPDADYRRLFLGEDGALHLKDSAGTVTATAGAETLPASIIAAKGDLIAGTANDTAAVLSVGTNDYVLTAASGEATGMKWAAAAGGGGGVLAAVSYSTASDSVWQAITSATWADIDATNAKLDITVPASGKILVQIQVYYQNTVAANTFYLGVRTGTTMLGYAMHVGGFSPPNTTNYDEMHTVMIHCSGLTPGALTIKAAARLGSASGNMNLYANDGEGSAGHVYPPFVMVAFAAP